MTKYAVALGSNLGDRLGHMRAGVGGLRSLGTVTGISSLYETAPVGGPENQGPYLNAVVVLESDLGPEDLMLSLLEIEKGRGRIRHQRWSPRTLDLDIVAYKGDPVSTALAEIPHPLAHERRFVLEPLCEVWPQAKVTADLGAEEALARLPAGGVFRWNGDWEFSLPRLGWIATGLVFVQLTLIALTLIVAFATIRSVPGWEMAVGMALAVVGSFMVAAGGLGLGRNLSALPEPRPGSTLTETGIYRRVRHPIYGGVIIGSVGLMLVAGSGWVGWPVVALAILLRVKSGFEERALRLAFPDYPGYSDRVRRRFIPFVW